MQEPSNIKVFGFAAIVTIICAVLLGLAATVLKDLQNINAEVDMKSKVLTAIGEYDVEKKNLTSKEMLAYFSKEGFNDKKLEQIFFDNAGNVISVPEDEQKFLVPEKMAKQKLDKIGKYPIYLYYASLKNKTPDAYVMPIFGKGLWSICYGFLALEKDASTIKALIYYSHGETPGLGAEIADNKEWVEQFTIGKKIVNAKGKLDVLHSDRSPEVRKNPSAYPNKFWHISGATFTVDGVNKMLQDFLSIYNNYLSKKRCQYLPETVLKDLQNINAEVDMKSKVLTAIGEYDVEKKNLTSKEMLSYFTKEGFNGKKLEQIFFDNKGKVISVPEDEQKFLTPEKMAKQKLNKIGKYPIYLYYASLKNKKPDAYVMPVFGKGLWSICYGFLALEKDASTIKALIYYSHDETPGLGAEIADNKEWVEQFTMGKKIVNAKGKLDVLHSDRSPEVRKNPSAYPNKFWHISGATFTVDGVNKMLQDFLSIYNNYLSKKRGQ